MNSAGEIVAIARHIRQRAPIEELDSVRITLESGVEGDCHGDPGPSQVTLVSEEAWRDAIADLGIALPWTLRRANVLVRGVDLFNTSGLRLHLGDVVLEITGENDPCWLMDKQHRGLRKALTPRWRAGVACRVIKSGIVEVGDRV
ncbi:MAG TPA: MOSC domain-containing protein, partial [Candidatus Binataceae bacterium]|nr:MOSC domain-containing protein [Candidatus Binataceae bacterium]